MGSCQRVGSSSPSATVSYLPGASCALRSGVFQDRWGPAVTLGSEFKGLGLEQAKILLGCPEAPVSIVGTSRTFLPQATAAGPPDKLD